MHGLSEAAVGAEHCTMHGYTQFTKIKYRKVEVQKRVTKLFVKTEDLNLSNLSK